MKYNYVPVFNLNKKSHEGYKSDLLFSYLPVKE